MPSIPVTVIIPCYNCHETLERAVRSVQNQQVIPEEIILVDDASQDEGRTHAVIRAICELQLPEVEPRINCIFMPSNEGPGAARNRGWDEAKSSWIAFLDADDTWHPSKLRIQWQLVNSDHSIDMISTESQMSKPGKAMVQDMCDCPEHMPRFLTLRTMLLSNRVFTRTVMMKRQVGLRFPVGVLSEDYSLWLQMISKGYNLAVVDLPLAFHYREAYSSGGLSGNLVRQECGELAAYKALYKSGGINLFIFGIVTIFSLLKFTRRVIVKKYRALELCFYYPNGRA